MTSPSAEPDETEVRGESSEGGDVPAAGENKERDTAASNACSPPQTGGEKGGRENAADITPLKRKTFYSASYYVSFILPQNVMVLQ